MNPKPDIPDLRGVPVLGPHRPPDRTRWHEVIADEGFRLFFPLAATQAALWPLL